jgi:hypothetical protein
MRWQRASLLNRGLDILAAALSFMFVSDGNFKKKSKVVCFSLEHTRQKAPR